MRQRLRILGALCAAALMLAPAQAAKPAHGSDAHQFGAIGHVLKNGADEAQLRRLLTSDAEGELAFTVLTGLKSPGEPCSDKIYQRRHDLIEESLHPLIVSLAASDWSECKNSAGRSAAVERLSRIRELLFGEPTSHGLRKLPLTRMSTSAKFRSYAENAHWAVGKVLYATVNLPSNNNHYRREAGRNSEFEDRLVANRSWLHRLFALAEHSKMDALVLFSEGGVGLPGEDHGGKEDGFVEIRHQILMQLKKFPGKLLLVDSEPAAAKDAPAIVWQGNLGHLSLGSSAVTVQVAPGAPQLFTLKPLAAEAPAQ